MKLLDVAKDGGKESRVWGFFLVEIKRLFTVAFLRFEDGSRDAYHSHAFNSISWVLRGRLEEKLMEGLTTVYEPSIWPIITTRDTFHQVVSTGNTYVFTLRGPWKNTWKEFLPALKRHLTLTHGRQVVAQS